MTITQTTPADERDWLCLQPDVQEKAARLTAAMDATFQPMVGTVRTDRRGLRYRVDEVRFHPATRHQPASVSVSGRVVDDRPQGDGPNSPTWSGAAASELFYDVPAAAPVSPELARLRAQIARTETDMHRIASTPGPGLDRALTAGRDVLQLLRARETRLTNA